MKNKKEKKNYRHQRWWQNGNEGEVDRIDIHFHYLFGQTIGVIDAAFVVCIIGHSIPRYQLESM